MGDCATPLNASAVGCARTVHACFDATRSGCQCTNGECAVPKETCFPPPECPAKVTASGARCLRVDDGKTLLAINEGCACGCSACVPICDGKGPTIALKLPNPPTDLVAPMSVGLPELPDKGTLGVYVRYRGQSANMALIAGGGAGPGAPKQLAITTPTPDFIEATFEGMATWAQKADAPTVVLFVVQQGATAMEVDCVIPYVTATGP